MPRDISHDQPLASMLKAIEEQLDRLLDKGPPDLEVLCLAQKLQLWAYEIKERIERKTKSRVRSRPAATAEDASKHRPCKRQREAADLLRFLATSAPRQGAHAAVAPSLAPREPSKKIRRARTWTKIHPRKPANESPKPAVVARKQKEQRAGSSPEQLATKMKRANSTEPTKIDLTADSFPHPTSGSPKFFYMNVPSALKTSAVLPRTSGLARFFDNLRKTRDSKNHNHGHASQPKVAKKEPQTLDCRVCRKRFRSAQALREHMVEHVSMMSDSRRKTGGYREAWKQNWFLDRVNECTPS